MRDRIEKEKLKKERQRHEKRNILRMKFQMERDVLEVQKVKEATIIIQKYWRGYAVRRQKREKAEAVQKAHINMAYARGLVDDCYDHIQSLKL